MLNKFNIIIPNTITRLSGNEYGVEVFNKQVKEIIDYNSNITIIFPKNIRRVATSFSQGFFIEIIRHLGLNGFIKNVEIESETISNLKQRIIDDLR